MFAAQAQKGVVADGTGAARHSQVAAQKRTVMARLRVVVEAASHSRVAAYERTAAAYSGVVAATCKRTGVVYSRAVADRTGNVDNRVAADKPATAVQKQTVVAHDCVMADRS